MLAPDRLEVGYLDIIEVRDCECQQTNDEEKRRGTCFRKFHFYLHRNWNFIKNYEFWSEYFEVLEPTESDVSVGKVAASNGNFYFQLSKRKQQFRSLSAAFVISITR